MRISYSAFDTFTRCPLKYKLSYVERIEVPKKAEFFFGGLIHDTVQFALKKDPIIPNVEELVDYFKTRWHTESFASSKEAEQYFELGQNMIRNFHAGLKPGLRNIIATEKRFSVPLSDKHTLVGMIDRIDKLPFGAFEVIDYKTSKNVPSKQDVDKDKQLGIYNLAVNKMWPEAKDIRLTLYFLKHPQQVTTTRRKDELEAIEKEVVETAEKIEKETEFKPKINTFCDWCDYQHLCPLQKDKIDQSQKDIDNIIQDYIAAREKIDYLEPKIHAHFDAKKIEEFSHKENTIKRDKNKKLSIKKL